MHTPKWTEIKSVRMLHFLDVYRKHECLWNPRLDVYKNKAVREIAYKELIKDLAIPNLTVNDIKLKIKGLRTTYRKEAGILEKRQSEGKVYVPKLFWFDKADSFLRDVSHSRAEQAVFKFEALANDRSAHNCDETNMMDDDANGTHVEYLTPDDLDHDDTMTENISKNVNIDMKPNCGSTYVDYDPTSEEVSAPIREHIAENMQSSTNIYSSEKRDTNNEDEYDLFCRSVAMQLRGIPDAYSRSVAKFKIQQILFEAETGHYKKSPCITIPAASSVNNL